MRVVPGHQAKLLESKRQHFQLMRMLLGRLTLAMTKRANIARWSSWILTAAVFSAACWFLSQWQFARQAEVVEANQVINLNFELEPAPIDQVLTFNQPWTSDLEFRPVVIEGSYLPETKLLIRNRPYDGQPGFLQLVAFEMTNGTIIWIERGWLPTGINQDSPDAIPDVDSSFRTVIIRLRSSESPDARQAPTGQLPSIDIPKASLLLTASNVYKQSYGRLATEQPELNRGVDLGKPQLSEGNHLSYAFQWIIFGLMALGAVFWNISQDRRRLRGEAPRRLAALNRDKDGEIEDQILEK